MAIIQNLIKRVDDLEAEVAELRKLVEGNTTKPAATPKPKGE